MRAPDPRTVEFYDGLVFKTASLWAGYMQEDFEDLQQIIWEKVVKALRAYDPARSKLPTERYVFMCVMNLRKDLLKRRRRDDSYIEDEHPAFERRYRSEVDTYDGVEAERPLIPSTLGYLERHVLALLYEGYTEREVQRRLGCTRRECEAALNGLQAKFGDWKPSPDERKMKAAA
jgi:RNA polymerase sigma factor (sigma-70 family)